MERKMCGHGVPKNWHQKKEEAVPKAKKKQHICQKQLAPTRSGTN
jgi:hypothetical protein